MVSRESVFVYLSLNFTSTHDLSENFISTVSVNGSTEQTTWSPSMHTIQTINNENEQIISNDLRKFFEVMNFVILSGIISFFGSIANIINILVFTKQKFTDPVNISLLGLSVSDLGALVTLVWMSICFNPLFADSGIGFDSIRVQYLTAGWPHVCCARITSWITAFVTFERCLCIAMPLKVKTIITPKRTTFAIICIFVVMVASVCPVYYAISLGPAYDKSANKSRISLVYRLNGPNIEKVSFAFNVLAQISSFILVIICTIVLVQSLLRKSKWRETSTAAKTLTQRDKRLIKMVISLSTIFIVCFLPSAVNLIVMILTPGYSIVGKQANMFQVGWSFLNTLEATNSSVSVFVYYSMSSRYRIFFRRLFGIKQVKERDHIQSSTIMPVLSS